MTLFCLSIPSDKAVVLASTGLKRKKKKKRKKEENERKTGNNKRDYFFLLLFSGVTGVISEQVSFHPEASLITKHLLLLLWFLGVVIEWVFMLFAFQTLYFFFSPFVEYGVLE